MLTFLFFISLNKLGFLQYSPFFVCFSSLVFVVYGCSFPILFLLTSPSFLQPSRLFTSFKFTISFFLSFFLFSFTLYLRIFYWKSLFLHLTYKNTNTLKLKFLKKNIFILLKNFISLSFNWRKRKKR